jgi:hypothetical protein
MTTYLVQYGRSAFLGWFDTASRENERPEFTRGDRVVLRGARGEELGTILGEVSHSDRPDGRILRLATVADAARAEQNEARGREVLAAAEELAAAADLPLVLVDIELSLDGTQAVLHALPWAECDASPLLDQVAARFGLEVRLLDLSRTPTAADPPATSGCGKPGCGSGSGGCDSCGTGGGCSTGSCSRGKVKSADDLTAYFAELRRNMEARTPLV